MKRKILMVILGSLICALSFNIFLAPYHFVPGGVTGISIIFNRLFNLNNVITIFLLEIMFLLLCFTFLGKKSFLQSLLGSILFPTFIFLTSLILKYFDLEIYNRLLASIAGGFTFGLGIGLIYKEGYLSGGSEIIAKIIHYYTKISLGLSTLIIDGLITIGGCFVFGFETLIYSVITLYIMYITINKVMLGLFGNKSFYIITTKPNKIRDYILNELGHGATIIDGKGAYSDEKKSIILVVIPTGDYYKLKEGIAKLDSDAFFVVCDSYEVGGGK